MTENRIIDDNNKTNEPGEEQKNLIMKNLIKENEIISKVIKGKMSNNEALNQLLLILNEQRDYIENISEEHFMLEKSVTRLNTSIDILKTKLKVEHHDDLDINKIINANKVQFKPNEAISFGKLNNQKKAMNNTFSNRKKIKVPIKINSTDNNSSNKTIDYDRLLQMSVSDFKKRKLKPINKNKINK